MSPTTDMYVLLRAFTEELANCGMRAACTSPGSRCAPLVISLGREERVRCYSHIDERCAGFFALGLAKASGAPVAVTCTSGTAAAELLPAAIEAHEARVPLLLLTADRPAELRGNGAGQAIDQLKLFGAAAKWFFEVAMHDAGAASLRWMRTLACRAYWTALEGRPGVVHLNFPLREPLVQEGKLSRDESGRGAGTPYVARTPSAPGTGLSAGALEEVRTLIAGSRRGVVVAGREERDDQLALAASAFAEGAGWPLLADPLSRARRGESAIAHYDALLRDGAFAAAMAPEVVVRVGDLPVSKPLREWLARRPEIPQVALDPEGAWQDPAAVLSLSLACAPAATLTALAEALPPAGSGDAEVGGWLSIWREVDALASGAIAEALAEEPLSEPSLARALCELLPAAATLFVASSMPVRDIETFWAVRDQPPRVLCNRGANGIDGIVSSAFGAAAHGAGPVVLLIGDVALAHDIGGLLAASRLGLSLTVVLVDNGGGGIFDFLPVSGSAMAEGLYEHHVATPPGIEFARAAALYGIAHEPVASLAELQDALECSLAREGDSTIVHVRGDRARNVELHREVWSAVSAALAHRDGATAARSARPLRAAPTPRGHP